MRTILSSHPISFPLQRLAPCVISTTVIISRLPLLLLAASIPRGLDFDEWRDDKNVQHQRCLITLTTHWEAHGQGDCPEYDFLKESEGAIGSFERWECALRHSIKVENLSPKLFSREDLEFFIFRVILLIGRRVLITRCCFFLWNTAFGVCVVYSQNWARCLQQCAWTMEK